MNLSFVTIDNFYDDPDKVRDFALKAEYNKPGQDKLMNIMSMGAWPGQTSLDVYKYNPIDSVVSKILNKPLRQLSNSGKFRITYQNQTALSPLHIDSVSSDGYAGVLYLSDPVVSTPGTLFYKHKKTNSTTVDEQNLKDLEKDINDITKWEVDTIAYIRYNRLIVYPSNRWHGAAPGFGTTIDNARLVQLFLWGVVE